MHERHPFSMRGNSLVGAVLAVALLSATAIAIDSRNMSINQNSLLAQAPATTPTTATAEVESIKCKIGVDFIIEQAADGKPALSYALKTDNRSRAKNDFEANRCNTRPGEPLDGTGYKPTPVQGGTLPDRWCQDQTTSNRVRDRNSWTCRTYVCRLPKDTSKSKANVCFTPKEVTKIGEVVKIEEAIKGAEKAAVSAVSSNDATAAQDGSEFMTRLPLAESDQILKSMETTDQQIAKERESVKPLESEQQKLLQEYGSSCRDANGKDLQPIGSRAGAFLSSSCSSKSQRLQEIDQKIAVSEENIRKLEEQKGRLAALQKSLTPKDAQPPPTDEKKESQLCPGGPGCGGGEWNPNTGRLETTFKKDDGDNGDKSWCTGPLAYLCRNANQPGPNEEDIYLCDRLRDRAACMRVAEAQGGVGAYGGYGGAYSSGGQPCSAQRQQQPGILGIITTITSLFGTKSSSGNCGTGTGSGSDAPIPTCRITASPQNIASSSQPVTLTWQSEKAFSATLSNSGNVSTQGSMTVNPQTTTTYTLSLGGFQDNRTGQQLRGQCAVQVVAGTQGGGTGDGAVKAEISCRPQVADVGMSVAVSFACRNANTSVGKGFSTANQMSGSATPVVAQPTIGSDSVTYGLTCSKEGKTDTAQCTVEINKVSIVLIANPKDVESGKESNIGWITSGMESCTVSSPTLSGFTAENAGSTNVSGVAKSPPLTADTKFVLSCTTKAGGTKTAETTVKVGN